MSQLAKKWENVDLKIQKVTVRANSPPPPPSSNDVLSLLSSYWRIWAEFKYLPSLPLHPYLTILRWTYFLGIIAPLIFLDSSRLYLSISLNKSSLIFYTPFQKLEIILLEFLLSVSVKISLVIGVLSFLIIIGEVGY